MPKAKDRLKTYSSSLYLLAVVACLCPVAAGAQSWNPTDSDSSGNTAAGTDALLGLTTGFSNTAIGRSALKSNTTGADNTAAGDTALRDNTSGGHNAAAGYAALRANTTGDANTASGSVALLLNTTGSNNTASGYSALFSNTTGRNNVGLGYRALDTNQTGNNNVAVGYGALIRLAGSGNIALGAKAGKNTKTGNNNIYIGHAGINGSESRVTRIGQVQRKVFIAGIAGVPGNGAHVVVRANGQLGVLVSSARYKQDIKPLDDMAGKLAQLRPVSYRYKADPQAMHYGLIAEEVTTVMPELVIRDGKNRPDSVQYLELVPLLLQQWKAQQAVNARQRELIARQQARLDRQEADLAELRRTLATRLAVLDGESREN